MKTVNYWQQFCNFAAEFIILRTSLFLVVDLNTVNIKTSMLLSKNIHGHE